MSIAPERRTQVAAVLKYAEVAPGAADQLSDQLQSFAERAAVIREFGLAEVIGQAMARLCRDEHHRFRAQRLIERIAFERSYDDRHERDQGGTE